MIFNEIGKFFAFLKVPRKRVRFALPKFNILRRINSRIRPFKKLGWRRGWIYVYAFLVILAPFYHVNPVTAPIMDPVKPKPVEAQVDKRVGVLKNFLKKYNSPLTPHADKFISVADRYGFDWRFLPAIAGTESTFGRHYVRGTYNPFGWGGGWIYFKSWDHGIETVGKTLWEKYLLKGKRPLTIEGIGDIYATSPHWPKSVRFWMAKISPAKVAALK